VGSYAAVKYHHNNPGAGIYVFKFQDNNKAVYEEPI
jgi:hypothetical protein